MLRRWSRWCANQDNRARLSADTWRKDATVQYRIQGSGVASLHSLARGGTRNVPHLTLMESELSRDKLPLRVDFCVFPSARSWYRQSLVCLKKPSRKSKSHFYKVGESAEVPKDVNKAMTLLVKSRSEISMSSVCISPAA